MKITFLGTGTSQGVPMIGCDCAVCRSNDPRDRRTRSSIFIEDTVNILVDTSPDFWAQAIRENIKSLDAVLITHAHADHIMGFDDLRRFCEVSGRSMPVYAAPKTMARLKQIFYYAFEGKPVAPGYLYCEAHEAQGKFKLGEVEILSFPLPHGPVTTLGFIFARDGRKRMAYFNDCKGITEEAMREIEDIPVLIIDALRDKPHPSHLTIAESIAISRKARAQKTYFTHLTHEKSHVQRQSEAPDGIFISYDGLQIEL